MLPFFVMASACEAFQIPRLRLGMTSFAWRILLGSAQVSVFLTILAKAVVVDLLLQSKRLFFMYI